MMKKTFYLAIFLVAAALQADVTKDLFDGIEEHNQEKIEQAIKNGANVHAVNFLDKTPLHEAAHSHSPAIKPLVLAGADLEAGDEDNWTPLTFAALCNIHAIQKLIDQGAKVNHIDGGNKTPLDYAKDDQSRAILLRNGAKTAYELLSNKK